MFPGHLHADYNDQNILVAPRKSNINGSDSFYFKLQYGYISLHIMYSQNTVAWVTSFISVILPYLQLYYETRFQVFLPNRTTMITACKSANGVSTVCAHWPRSLTDPRNCPRKNGFRYNWVLYPFFSDRKDFSVSVHARWFGKIIRHGNQAERKNCFGDSVPLQEEPKNNCRNRQSKQNG